MIRLVDEGAARGFSGEVWAMRETAREIAESVPDGPVQVDFTGVWAVAGCFADELLARLEDRVLSIVGCFPEVREDLEIVVDRRGLDRSILGGEP